MKLQLAANTSKSRAAKQFVFQTMPDLKRLQLLTEADKKEVLSFLKVRPVHTVVMTSFIRDNGLENESNRGKFYGYRNPEGTLEAVALIGHTTLIETRSEKALKALATIARQSETPIHLIMSDDNTIERFWRNYTDDYRQPRLVCTELLFELNFPFLVQECEWEIRNAKVEELEMIAEAHAEVALIESGVNPLEKDREGFLRRCLRRIEQGRTFVVTENGKLIFKADVVAETDDVIYLEGIYVAPEMRGQNIGSKCLAKLGLQLLERAQHICLLSNVDFKGAHRSFEKAGFKNTDRCQSIFV
jgi:uncharacterized protein